MIPLSTRMRPTSAEEFVGQRHFFYKGSLLYNSIQKKTFDSAIFFGPSGTGKTTLARLIASSLDSGYIEINAGTTGTGELMKICKNSEFFWNDGKMQRKFFAFFSVDIRGYILGRFNLQIGSLEIQNFPMLLISSGNY